MHKKDVFLRSGATIIDYTLIFIIYFLFIMAFGKPDTNGGKSMEGVIVLFPLFIGLSYLIATEVVFKATIGHKILGLEVRSVNKKPLTLLQVSKRRFADLIDFWVCLGLLALIIVLVTKKGQRLGDFWAKTIVINRRNDDILFFSPSSTA